MDMGDDTTTSPARATGEKHSPGPWAVVRKGLDLFIQSASITNKGNPTNGQNWICRISQPKTGEPFYGFGHAKITRDDIERSDANASLIASAPDLLETCVNTLNTLIEWGDGYGELADALRAVIRKAKGRDHA